MRLNVSHQIEGCFEMPCLGLVKLDVVTPFCEAKYQAIEACMRYLGKPENAELEFMYAITSFGTKGRAWKYERGMDYLTALFGPESLFNILRCCIPRLCLVEGENRNSMGFRPDT